MKDVYTILQQSMQTDDVDTESIAEGMQSTYETSTAAEKAAIDRMLIAICGYSFPALLAQFLTDDKRADTEI